MKESINYLGQITLFYFSLAEMQARTIIMLVKNRGEYSSLAVGENYIPNDDLEVKMMIITSWFYSILREQNPIYFQIRIA